MSYNETVEKQNNLKTMMSKIIINIITGVTSEEGWGSDKTFFVISWYVIEITLGLKLIHNTIVRKKYLDIYKSTLILKHYFGEWLHNIATYII